MYTAAGTVTLCIFLVHFSILKIALEQFFYIKGGKCVKKIRDKSCKIMFFRSW